MNILFISNLYPGKPDHSVKEISYALHDFTKIWKKNGNNVVVIRPLYPNYRNVLKNKELFEKMPYEYELDGIKIYNIHCYIIPRLRHWVFCLPPICETPDIIIGHMSGSFVLSKKLANRFKVPYVLGVHNSDISSSRLFRRELDGADRIACRSNSIKMHFLQMYPQYEGKIFISNSGIASEDIEDNVFFVRKIKDIGSNSEPVFVTASLLQKLKNIDVTIRALAKFREFGWQYYILGDGEERKNLESLITDYNLEDKIHILGFQSRDRVLEFMKKSHYYIMISAPETFGLAFLEAMAKANIVIGCKNWGIAGVVKNGENGFLLEERNQDELEDLLGKIFSKQIDVEKILNNVEKTIHRYTQEIVGEEYQTILESLV